MKNLKIKERIIKKSQSNADGQEDHFNISDDEEDHEDSNPYSSEIFRTSKIKPNLAPELNYSLLMSNQDDEPLAKIDLSKELLEYH